MFEINKICQRVIETLTINMLREWGIWPLHNPWVARHLSFDCPYVCAQRTSLGRLSVSKKIIKNAPKS